MPRNNCDPAPIPPDPESGDQRCPKCGVEMEPIESNVEGLPLQQLQLCPGCYLVIWSDLDGLHVRQGVPMGPMGTSIGDDADKDSSSKNGAGAHGHAAHMIGEPTDC
jgi:hypothetical protein